MRMHISLRNQARSYPERALPFSKDVIRAALLVCAGVETDAETRERFCSMYMLLEEFLLHEEWLVVHEWDRLIKAQEVDAVLKGGTIGHRALALIEKRNARQLERIKEFRRTVAEFDASRAEAQRRG